MPVDLDHYEYFELKGVRLMGTQAQYKRYQNLVSELGVEDWLLTDRLVSWLWWLCMFDETAMDGAIELIRVARHP